MRRKARASARGRVGVPGVEPGDRVRPVERQGAHALGVAHGEGLAVERAVRVAVQVDLLDAELVQHGDEVLGGVAGAVQGRGGAELLRARAGVRQVVARVRLERRAVQRAGAARAARVDQQHVAPAGEVAREVEVPVAARGRRVAGPALHEHERAERRLVGLRARVELEADADARVRGRVEPVERHADRAALGPVDVGAGLQVGGRGRGGEHGEDQQGENEREPTHGASLGLALLRVATSSSPARAFPRTSTRGGRRPAAIVRGCPPTTSSPRCPSGAGRARPCATRTRRCARSTPASRTLRVDSAPWSAWPPAAAGPRGRCGSATTTAWCGATSRTTGCCAGTREAATSRRSAARRTSRTATRAIARAGS